jgi:hypothetical protein
MASTIDICNQALVKLGSSRIASLTDDSKQAAALSTIYETKLRAELAAYPWTFAMDRVALPAAAASPSFGWLYQYPLPTDFLRMVEVGEYFVLYQPDITMFALEGRNILTDEGSPLRIRYIKYVANTGLYPALFVEALACRLAAELAEDLTQSLSKREAMEGAYERAIRIAKRSNAIQLPPQPTPEDTWLLARRGARG